VWRDGPELVLTRPSPLGQLDDVALWRIRLFTGRQYGATMSTDETDLLLQLEGLAQGFEAWEIARRYRIRHRDCDAQRPTVEVEMMFLVTTDAARKTSASSPQRPDLNVVMATVRWEN
jgi:hypothetical protein